MTTAAATSFRAKFEAAVARQATRVVKIEDPTDDSYDEFEDPREEQAEDRVHEPDPVTAAIPIIDVEEAPHDAQ